METDDVGDVGEGIGSIKIFADNVTRTRKERSVGMIVPFSISVSLLFS